MAAIVERPDECKFVETSRRLGLGAAMGLKKRTIDDDETFQLIDDVCRRPKMFYANADSLRDVLAFINGISCGMAPPHGCLHIAEFVWDTFQSSRDIPWTTVVLSELGDLPFHDACEALGRLFRDFRSTMDR